jgi:hypothetical protein
MRSRRWSPVIIVVMLWIASLIILGVAFFSAAIAAKNATGTLDKAYHFLGMPLLVGFRHNGKIGTHLQWGSLVLLVGPLLLGLVIAVVQSSRAWARSAGRGTAR